MFIQIFKIIHFNPKYQVIKYIILPGFTLFGSKTKKNLKRKHSNIFCQKIDEK